MTEASPSSPGRRSRLLRLGGLALVLAGLYAGAHYTGLTQDLDAEKIRTIVQGAGPLGWIVYIGVFAAGTLGQLPGFIFVAAASLIYGRFLGFFLALTAAFVSVCVSFLVVRAVGGRALTEFDNKLLTKMLTRLDERPVVTVILLRLVFMISPPLNYALGLSNIGFRDYAVASAIGLIPPILGMTIFFDWLLT